MKSLPVFTLFQYGAIAFPLAMLGLPLYIYLPAYYAQTVGINVGLVGMILLIARLSDVVTDPLIGIFSDGFHSRFGKRKPFMAAGIVLLAGSFYALVHPPGTYEALWLLGFSVLIYFGWSLISVPYLALSAEITPVCHENTKLSAARELMTILGAVTALIIPYLFDISQNTEKSLQMLFATFMAAMLIVTPIALVGLKENSAATKNRIDLEILKALWRRIPSLGRLQSAFLINALANALPASLFLFYVEFILHAKEQTGMLLLLYFLSGIIGLPFWIYISKKLGKQKAWMYSMLLASSAFIFVPLLGSGDLVYFVIISFVSGLSLGSDMALPAAIQVDIVQKLQDGESSYAGILFGIWAMLTKFSLALSVGIGFVILGAFGFEPSAPTSTALTALSLLYGLAPVILKLTAFWIMRRYDEKA